jgi:hypothetical protein
MEASLSKKGTVSEDMVINGCVDDPKAWNKPNDLWWRIGPIDQSIRSLDACELSAQPPPDTFPATSSPSNMGIKRASHAPSVFLL